MKITETYIALKGIQLYARHGVAPQEQIVGGNFTVDLRLKAQIEKACLTDDLNETINYASVFEIVKEEMAIPSKLLEHAASRIAEHLLQEFPKIKCVEIRLIKNTPPMGADCEGASVELICER